MGASIYDNEYHYWEVRSESKLKKEIKNEKFISRRTQLQKIYDDLKKRGVYKKQKEEKKEG